MENSLFIGGPKDGEWLPIEEGRQQVSMPEITSPMMSVEESVTAEGPTYKMVVYERNRLTAGGRLFEVFAPLAMPGDVMMETLINGYRATK